MAEKFLLIARLALYTVYGRLILPGRMILPDRFMDLFLIYGLTVVREDGYVLTVGTGDRPCCQCDSLGSFLRII